MLIWGRIDGWEKAQCYCGMGLKAGESSDLSRQGRRGGKRKRARC